MRCRSNLERTAVALVSGLMLAAACSSASTECSACHTSSCPDPVFETSDPNGGWSVGGYYVHNNMWNCGSYACSETLYACSYDNWYVVANLNNDSGDGAVKTYPNVHKDYGDVPIGSFHAITSTFAETSPHVGIYNVAFDIWINGIASTGCTEIMIWNENHNQVPAGTQVETVTLGGRTYHVWKTPDSGYIAFVPTVIFTSGTVDLLEIFQWVMGKNWLPSDSWVSQIDFGVEIVSTDGRDAVFEFTDFSITDS
jgi:glycosyl hydrolase family 12